MKLKNFFSSKGIILALIVTIVYGSLIFWIYDSGYQGVPKDIKELPVTIVNQDFKSKKLAQQLKKSLPFKDIHESENLSQSKKDLQQRKTYLLINIPPKFTQDIKQGHKVKLHFYLNDSNPTAIANSLNLMTQRLGQIVNQNLALKKQTLILAQPALRELKQSIQQQQIDSQAKLQIAQQQIALAPAAQQPQLQVELRQQIQAQKQQAKVQIQQQKRAVINRNNMKAQNVVQPVTTRVHHRNYVHSGMNNLMAPFFNNIALYLGAMIGSLILYGVYVKFVSDIGRLRAFADLELAFVFLAVVGSAIVTAITLKIMPISFAKYCNIMLGHIVSLFLYYNFNLIMILLFGQIGASFNIIFTMIQIVSGAGIVPVLVMNNFFKSVHYFSPLYYGIQNDFNLMYGGDLTSQQQIGTILLLITCLCINFVIVTIRKKQPMLHFESLS
ncbi:hypothetical protein DS831_00375 [Bombilactobacillus bombi]|uniref:ABC-2 type transporter transmembrane domain-containing protein n=1 Tax=Bombilactobacillus bombi TaxID=1303590 RepID=A0A417ZIN0_9LACO|nr:ABC transporter permease [Bombilactobacillus bombi]RHW51827.1 hypothetical protein DS831_00375 [Bombilactobacillus bombi]